MKPYEEIWYKGKKRKLVHYFLWKVKSKEHPWYKNDKIRDFLMNIYFLLHGIESGFKMCCIMAFIKDDTYAVWGRNQALCRKCYDKEIIKGREGVFRYGKLGI